MPRLGLALFMPSAEHISKPIDTQAILDFGAPFILYMIY